MKPELKDIEFDEPYVIDGFSEIRQAVKDKDNNITFDETKLDTEDTDYLLQMKTKNMHLSYEHYSSVH